MYLSFSPFPYLQTERLQLRPIALDDDRALFFQRTDPGMNRYIDRKKPENVEEVRQFIQTLIDAGVQGKSVFWVISLKDNPALIGTICLWNLDPERDKAEIGYALHPNFQGQGYMQEAFEKVVQYAFADMQAKTVEGVVHPENLASVRVLERNGFRQTGMEDNLLVYELKSF
ncbi:MAG: GNAT family N-acetyltransferase [Bacteroidetes bacterium]|nr:GNAT family N-acetyltransferase [Bacteroidota bacterium]